MCFDGLLSLDTDRMFLLIISRIGTGTRGFNIWDVYIDSVDVYDNRGTSDRIMAHNSSSFIYFI